MCAGELTVASLLGTRCANLSQSSLGFSLLRCVPEPHLLQVLYKSSRVATSSRLARHASYPSTSCAGTRAVPRHLVVSRTAGADVRQGDAPNPVLAPGVEANAANHFLERRGRVILCP